MPNKQNKKVDTKRISPQPIPSLPTLSPPTPLLAIPMLKKGQEISDRNDYIIGAFFILFGIAFTIILGWFYWFAHGGLTNPFSFWTTGNLEWLEVLFWSLLTVHVWNMTDVAYGISNNSFKKRYILWYLSRMFEAPPVSLALVVVIFNFGISFGDAKFSLTEAPILLVIAFAIISAYFSRQTINALQSVANWIVKQIKTKPTT
jgi:hypothetical protein